MKRKKGFGALLVPVLVWGMTMPVFADQAVAVRSISMSVGTSMQGETVDESKAKISKAEAEETAKKFLKEHFSVEVDEKFQTRYELRQDYEFADKWLWNINWDLFNNEKSTNISVTVDGDTGKIINTYRYEHNYNQQQPQVATLTEKEAEKKAQDFLKKINPVESQQVKPIETPMYNTYGGSYYPRNYYFRYVRLIDGIEFDRNDITIEIDGTNGSIRSYGCRWNDQLNVPAKTGVIGEEKAAEILKKEVQMNLNYIPLRKDPQAYDERVERAKLVYSPGYSNGSWVDAKEGTVLNWQGNEEEERQIKDLTAQQKEAIAKLGKPAIKKEKEIDRERASAVIQQIIEDLFGEGYEIDSLQYIENGNYWETLGNKTWTAQFNKGQSFMRREGGNISINASTEELMTIYSYRWYEETEAFEPKLTWSEAYDQATQAIGKYFPNRIRNIETEQVYRPQKYYANGKLMPEQYYYFHFPRMINGIPYGQDNISVSVDIKTGKITELRANWNDNLIFDSTQGIISKEKAKEIFLEKQEPVLKYTVLNLQQTGGKNPVDAKLVYVLQDKDLVYPATYLDAQTGKMVDYNGLEFQGKETGFKEEIKGHWAEKELSIMASQGLIDEKTFEAERAITKLEALKLMVNVSGYGSYMAQDSEPLKFTDIDQKDSSYKQLQMAVRYGLLENKAEPLKPEKTLSREEMAELLVKLMQYDPLAKAKDIYVLPFEDAQEVSAERVGYVALCRGLGIIGGSGGSFRPQDETTMAEMAAAVYKAMPHIRGIR